MPISDHAEAYYWPYDDYPEFKPHDNYVVMKADEPLSRLIDKIQDTDEGWLYLAVPAGPEDVYHVLRVDTELVDAIYERDSRLQDQPIEVLPGLRRAVPALEEGSVPWGVAQQRVRQAPGRCLLILRAGKPIGVMDPSFRGPPTASQWRAAFERKEIRIEDDRRLGVDAFLDGKLLEHALVAGRKTIIQVSIGPEGTAGQQLTEPVDLDFGDRDLLSLPVRFVHDGVDVQQTMHVRRDPTTRAAVTFEVTPAGAHFSALIIVYGEDGSTVIEGAAFSAAVVATDEDQQRSPETLQLVKVPVAGLAAPRAGAVGSVVTDGERAVVAAPQIPIRATAEAAVAGVASVVNGFRTAARNYVAKHGDHDITPALVAAAQAGYRLRNRLGLDALRDLDRIQVISFFAQSIFPLELVYDGEPPANEATRCDGWQQALETGTCPSCGDTAGTSRICPLRFWGLSKVIEHHVGNTTGSIPFAARQYFTADVEPIAAPSSTVIGASVKVIEALAAAASAGTDREALLSDVVAEADDFGVSSVVDDWEEWRTAIGEINPNLLVAMPHQDTKGGVPALELGGELEATFAEGHVRKAGETRGPIVLLLGCDTSTASDLIGSFASDMRRYAPVVIATIGKVVAEEAPLVASILIDSLEQAMRRPGATIGTALVEARRALLARSRVVGLLLVGHGDARWEVKIP